MENIQPIDQFDDDSFTKQQLFFDQEILPIEQSQTINLGDGKGFNFKYSKSHESKKLIFKYFSQIEGVSIMTVRFSNDDQYLAVGYSDGTVKIFNNSDASIFNQFNTAGFITMPVTSISADGTLQLFQPSFEKGKTILKISETDNSILCLDYRKDGLQFASAGEDQKIRIYDEESQKISMEISKGQWDTQGPSNRIFCLKYHPDNLNLLLSGGWDNTVALWDLREKHAAWALLGPLISGETIDLQSGKLLIGSYRGTDQLAIYDFATQTVIEQIESWGESSVQAALFKKNGKQAEGLLACGSNPTTMKLYNAQRNEVVLQIQGMKKTINSIDYGNVSDKIAFGVGDGSFYVLEFL